MGICQWWRDLFHAQAVIAPSLAATTEIDMLASILARNRILAAILTVAKAMVDLMHCSESSSLLNTAAIKHKMLTWVTIFLDATINRVQNAKPSAVIRGDQACLTVRKEKRMFHLTE